MSYCLDVTRDMLSGPIEIQSDRSPDFHEAREMADKKVAEIAEEPMLLGWFDKKAGECSPDVSCCNIEKPGWLVYAQSRGGTISVDINQEEYVFVYKPGM